MTARLKGRRRSAEEAARRITSWAGDRPDVRAVAVVGSYAYGRARLASDLDVVILSDDVPSLLRADGWVREALGDARPMRRADWGAIIEMRFRLRSGLQVELDIGSPSWASTTPVDDGTRRVVADGCIASYDPDGILGRLLAEVARRRPGGDRAGHPGDEDRDGIVGGQGPRRRT